ncbi:hypothetical protein BJ944DRAFT_237917 [Cunninghamella echinulata]|nr:hypothetical protein BJ944DRAFT_237917 [Cunninghamella echinulata]
MLYRHESLHIVHNRSHFFPKKITLQQQKFMSTIPPAKLKKKNIIYSTKKPAANIESKYENIIKEAIRDKRLDKIRSLIHHQQQQQQLGEERHNVIKLDRFQTWRPLLLMIRKSEQIEDLKWLETMIYEQKMITLYGLVPDLFDYHALMYCYGVQQQIDKAEQVIQKMYQQYKLTPSVYTNNTLLGCYQRNGDIDKALTFLQQQKEKGQPLKLDIASYNTVLAMLDKKERYQEALDLYDQLPFSPDRYTYSNMLRIVTQLKDTSRGSAIYNHLYKLLIDHHHQFTNQQQQQLPKTNHYHHNKKQFHRNHKNKSIDISTVNAMLAYQVSVMKNMDIVLNIYNEDLLPLYKHYDYLKPNTITCNIILDGVLKLQQNPGKASSLYHDMVHVHSFLQPDLTTFGILMDAKGLIGGSDSNDTSNRYTIQKQDINDALDLYEEAIATVKKTNKFKKNLLEEKKSDNLENDPLVIRLISSLAVTVSNLSYNNNNIKNDNDTTMDRLWELFITKWQRIIFHKKTYHGFLYGFAKAGRADLAQALYDRVFRYNTLCDADIVTYTGLMVAYIQSNQTNVAIEIYEVLKNHHYQSTESSSTSTKVQLDDVFFTTLISTMTNKISQLTSMDKIEKEMEFTLDMFMDMRSLRIQPHLHTYTAMLNCCGRAKHAEGLEQVHQLIKMDLHLDPDIAIYNALLDGYNRTDQIDRVLNLWDIMSTTSTTINSHQLMFDAATISIVLDACGHHNESLRGQSIWNFLNQIQYPLNTNHFNSYIEFLCRVGDGTVRNRKHQSNSELGKKYWLLAYKLMINEKMKLRFFPNEKTLNTLLSFARKYNIDQNLEIQQKIEKMKCVYTN